MAGLGVAVAFLLLLWCSLLYLPFRWRPVGIYLAAEKGLAIAYVPFIAVAGAALAVVGAVFGLWWIAVPAGLVAAAANPHAATRRAEEADRRLARRDVCSPCEVAVPGGWVHAERPVGAPELP